MPFVLLLILCSTHGQSVPLFRIEQQALVFQDNKVNISIPLRQLNQGQPLFHWTHLEWAQEVDAQGGLTQSNLDYLLNKEKAKKFRQYGGYYVSTDMWDSAWYGTHLLISRLGSSIFIAPAELVFQRRILKAYGGKPIRVQRALADAGVSGSYESHLVNKITWINLFEFNALQNIKLGKRRDFEDPLLSHSFLFESHAISKTVLRILCLVRPQILKNPEFLKKRSAL